MSMRSSGQHRFSHHDISYLSTSRWSILVYSVHITSNVEHANLGGVARAVTTAPEKQVMMSPPVIVLELSTEQAEI